MIARMLRTKGVFEYCEAARAVKKKYPDAEFLYLGDEGGVTVSDIQPYIDEGSIRYLGTTHDVRSYIADCAVFVLPSYREGFPMSIMEAASVGRAILTYDSIGCKETVKDGYNGFMVERKSLQGLVDKMLYCIEHPDEVVRMGKNSREMAETAFDRRLVNRKVLDVLSSEE
jgi:glycosyltransferase involved in cell wall biosynthesis